MPGEVARIFRVNGKTVTRWANSGRVPCVRTAGGHARFRAGVIAKLLAAGGLPGPPG